MDVDIDKILYDTKTNINSNIKLIHHAVFANFYISNTQKTIEEYKNKYNISNKRLNRINKNYLLKPFWNY